VTENDLSFDSGTTLVDDAVVASEVVRLGATPQITGVNFRHGLTADPPYDLRQDALVYRHWGWSIIPVAGKKPALCEWTSFQSRRASDRRIHWMFHSRNITGLAVILGRISGFLCCRDFDSVEWYLNWAAANPYLASVLPTVRTHRGFQVYCRLFAEVFKKFGDGELRARSDCYAVLPPSRHPKGVRYEWVRGYPTGPSAFLRLKLPQTGFDIDYSLPRVARSSRPVATAALAAQLRAAAEAGARKRQLQQPLRTQPGQQKAPPKNKKTSCVTLTTGRASDEIKVSQEDRGWGDRTDLGNQAIWEAIARSQPAGVGERHRRIFDLARSLKALPYLTDAHANALEGIIRNWHRKALNVIGTKSWKITWKDFRDAWERVKIPMGSGPLEEALRAAVAAPMPQSVIGFKDAPTRRLPALCAKLQALAGDRSFFLACRTAERLCGFTNQMTPARRLKLLVESGVLKLVSRGSTGAELRRAAEYRYLGLKE
jgi:hypothetical protein